MTTSDEPAASVAGARIRPRRGWVAAILSLAVPGLGHVYAGSPARAVGFWALLQVLGIAALVIAARLTVPHLNIVLPLALMLALWLLVAFDASARAARSEVPFRLPWPIRWLGYGGIWLAAGVPALLLALWTRENVVAAYSQSTSFMAPTLLRDEHFLLDRLAYGSGRPPQRGDIIVYEDEVSPPGRSTVQYVRRIKAAPGDVLSRAKKGATTPDGSFTHLPWGRWRESAAGDRLTLRAGEYVLATDRNDGELVEEPSVLGRVRVVYFSRDPATGGVRWNRMGAVVR